MSGVCATAHPIPQGMLPGMYHICHSVSTRTVIVIQQDGKLPLVLLLAALGVRSVRAEQEAALGLPVGEEACQGSSSSDK